MKDKLNIAMLGRKRILSREGRIEIVIVNVVGSSIAREADYVFIRWLVRRFLLQRQRRIVHS